jgi:hypothetical protein
VHIVLGYDVLHNSKGKRLVLQSQKQKASDEVHTLTVVELRVDHSVGKQDIGQIAAVDFVKCRE